MNPDWTIPAQLAMQADRRPDHPFLIHGETRRTYRDLHERVERLAAGLRTLGVQHGRTVATMLDNGTACVEVWFALSRVSAIQVPLNPEHRGPTMESMVRRSEADVLICTPDHFAQLAASTPGAAAAFRTIILEGPGEVPHLAGAARVLRLGDLDVAGADAGPMPAPTTPYGIMYTSGTTGPSKGVVVSHHYGVWAGHQQARIARLDERDVMYCVLPLFHQGGQADCILTMLAVGGSVAIVDRFSASRWWSDIERYGATTFVAFAAMLTILFKREPAASDAATPARIGLVGHVLPEMQRPFEERFGLRLLNVYGMTETEHSIFPKDWDATPVGSMGVADDEHFDVRLLGADDEPVPQGAVGEICVRPKRPHIMMEGYHGMPDETLAAYRNLWFHTGDLAREDADGFLFFVDRAKDSIRRRGENISSTEVEHVIDSHQDVAESAVVAVPSDLGEDEVMAFVVPRVPTLTPEELAAYASERMAQFMIPRYIELVAELPKTRTNKIAKSELKARGVGAATWDRADSPLRDAGRRRADSRC